MKRQKVNEIVTAFAGIIAFVFLSSCGQAESDIALFSTEETDTAYESGSAFEEESEPQTKGDILIYVCGAVYSPGVVTLPADSRACDAVEMAGGLTPEASQTAVNLAERLSDGQMLYIPNVWEEQAIAESEREASSGLININTADEGRLCELPGIGEAKARAIIAYREDNGDFTAVEEIMQVPGIKENLYDKICDMITVR